MSVALAFVSPPPGLAPLRDFTLSPVDGAPGLFSLQSVDRAGVRLFLVEAARCFPDYSPVISDEQCAMLQVSAPEETLVLLVANPGEHGITANLMAPVVVNTNTGACAQLILDDQDWPLRAELSARSA